MNYEAIREIDKLINEIQILYEHRLLKGELRTELLNNLKTMILDNEQETVVLWEWTDTYDGPSPKFEGMELKSSQLNLGLWINKIVLEIKKERG